MRRRNPAHPLERHYFGPERVAGPRFLNPQIRFDQGQRKEANRSGGSRRGPGFAIPDVSAIPP